MSKRTDLIERLACLGIVCEVANTDQYIVYIVNPLSMLQSIQVRIVGVDALDLTKVVTGFFASMHEEYGATSPAESLLTTRLITCLVNASHVLNPKSEVHLTTAHHALFNKESGIIIEDIYPDMGKLYPQPTVSIYSAGVFTTSGYATDLIFPE